MSHIIRARNLVKRYGTFTAVGGVFFPIEELPEWAQKVAWFLPVTDAVDVYRGFSSGNVE